MIQCYQLCISCVLKVYFFLSLKGSETFVQYLVNKNILFWDTRLQTFTFIQKSPNFNWPNAQSLPSLPFQGQQCWAFALKFAVLTTMVTKVTTGW